MNLIISTVLQEKQRISFMIEKYEKTMSGLPRGSISERHVGDKTYYYLKYRDGKKVISKYISPDKVENLREDIEKRKHTEAMLSSLRKEKELADKFLGGVS